MRRTDTRSGSAAHLHFHLLATHIPLPVFHLPLATLPVEIAPHAFHFMLPFTAFPFVIALHSVKLMLQGADFNLALQFLGFLPLIVMAIVVVMLILSSKFTLNRMPFGPTFLFGDLAGFHRLLDSLTDCLEFVRVTIGEKRKRTEAKKQQDKET